MKNKNKLCPYNKLSVFYNTCLKTFGSHLVRPVGAGLFHVKGRTDMMELIGVNSRF